MGDFRDGTNSDDDYEYWLDGSLKKDKNKKITSIAYNYLKLPEVITFDDNKTITTEYDASGTKLKKIVSGGETTDYEEDDIYVNSVLYQTSHDEGRIVDGVYEYNINDHLGNLRVAFRDSLGIAVPTQSIFYDSWGLSMKGMSITRNSLNFNKFQYNSKETQLETGFIDLGNRMINPTIGRMLSVDRFSEKYEHLSPFHFTGNNPINIIDINGDSLMLFKNGTYISTIDNGKKETTGFNQESKTDKSGKETFTGGQSFSFNDIEDDRRGITSGELKLRFAKDAEIQGYMNESGVNNTENKDNSLSYIERESRPINNRGVLTMWKKSSGLMDYPRFINRDHWNSLNVVDGIAYNNSDYGQFLWGMGGRNLGFGYETLRKASHLNNAFNSKSDNPNKPYSITDSPGDQRAIRNGYNYWTLKPKGLQR